MSNSFWVAVSLLAAGVVVAVRLIREGRDRAIARLRADWGQAPDRDRKMDAIVAAHRSRAAGSGGGAVLDDRTWHDLHLDAVFATCDRTESTLGQHALYHRLRGAPTAPHLDAFEALVTRMTTDIPARERAQLALSRLQDPHGYDLWWIGQRDVLDPRRWHIVFPLLAVSVIGLAALLPVAPKAIPALAFVIGASLLVRFTTDRRVLDVAAAFRQIAPIVATGQALRFLEGAEIAPIVSPLRSDTPPLSRLKTIARWVSGDPFMLSVRPGMLAVLVTSLVSVVYDYVNYVLLLDANGVYFGAGELRRHGPALQRVMAAVGDVDAAIAVASWRAGRADWTRPVFRTPGSPATLSDVRHPLVEDAVANSIEMPAGRGVLVTGSNMSGKSTFLRTVGVNAVLAQTIHTCLAASYAAPVFNVRTVIGRADDLLSGKSYYIVEVEALIALMRAGHGGAPHLFLLDEMFRGTNAVERIAAGQAVLRELVAGGDATRHVVMAATHDGELVDLLPDDFAAVHFSDTIGEAGMDFDYRLLPGRATTRNAIALLRLNGAPERVVTDALTCAATLDRERSTGQVPR